MKPSPAESQSGQNLKIEALENTHGIDKLVQVVAQLRSPEGGCPWDLKQTHHSLKPYLLEESYEALEAIDSNQPELLKEELGDVLLQVVLHAQIAQDNQHFDFAQVCEEIANKLIRRHPHVFAETSVENAEEVTRNWEAIKREEKKQAALKTGQPNAETEHQSVLDGVSRSLPALSRAYETSKKAVKVGFEWPNFESLWECVMSEYQEFRAEAEANNPHEALEEEMGDIFFASVNLARHFKIDPEVALTRATDKFSRRFQIMETLAGDRSLDSLDFETWDRLWNEAKVVYQREKNM